MSITKALSIPVNPLYMRILERFPKWPKLSFCFAYGSAVKKQLTLNSLQATPMVDLIYTTDMVKTWHEENLKLNASHYSTLKYFGPNIITSLQQNAGAKVYYNTLVPFEDILIKYGVISDTDLINDLLDWSELYIAGRLHKPVEIIIQPQNGELQTALKLNLQSAVHAALLILPETFSEYEFYYAISNLSYGGDFRMTFGENKEKVRNIVKPQIFAFRKLYRDILLSSTDYVDFPMLSDNCKEGDESDYALCSQDTSPRAKLHHLNSLPKWPQKLLTRFWNRGLYKQDTEDVLRVIAYDADCHVFVENCISEIVWKSSISQSLKGILTAGFLKSTKYSGRKIVKMLKS